MASPLVIVVAPDSFKGSLTAFQAAEAMRAGVLRACPDAMVHVRPMADGGEGTCAVVLTGGGRLIGCEVQNAAGVRRRSECAILPDGAGLIEVATIVGLLDTAAFVTPVEQRTTAGVGEAILELLRHGCQKIYLGLGGSSTNDGGFGMLAALGVRFIDSDGASLIPKPYNLAKVHSISMQNLDPITHGMTLIAISDVENSLGGSEGATYTFGPQKGVRADRIENLDASILRVAMLIEVAAGRQATSAHGSGAAGGLGFAIQVLGGASRSGASTVAELIGLDHALKGATVVFTGEGKSDLQTLKGKAPFWIARRAGRDRIPTILISGSVQAAAVPELKKSFAACFAIASGTLTLDEAMRDAELLLASQTEQVMCAVLCGRMEDSQLVSRLSDSAC